MKRMLKGGNKSIQKKMDIDVGDLLIVNNTDQSVLNFYYIVKKINDEVKTMNVLTFESFYSLEFNNKTLESHVVTPKDVYFPEKDEFYRVVKVKP